MNFIRKWSASKELQHSERGASALRCWASPAAVLRLHEAFSSKANDEPANRRDREPALAFPARIARSDARRRSLRFESPWLNKHRGMPQPER